MKKEAQSHEAEDKKKKEGIEIRNQADGLAYTAEKTIKEAQDKIDASDREKVEKAIAEVRKALAGEDIEAIKKAFEALQKDVYEVSAKIYKAAGPTPPGGTEGAGTGAGEEEKTVEAEAEVKEDKSSEATTGAKEEA